jgi:hypothetical protein
VRELGATARGQAETTIDRCFERLADVERYPVWYPTGVRRAEELERGADGAATKVKATLALAHGPIQRDFTLHLGVTVDRPRLVELRRLPKEPGDQEQVTITWRLSELGSERTQLAVELAAKLDIPRFLPLGGVADHIARGFLDAAVASFRA